MTVLIPTWRRPAALGMCLSALGRQTVAASQIVITVRVDDELTLDRLAAMRAAGKLPNGVEVERVGPVPLTAAMNAGLAVTTGELVALTDDDAEPWPDWLERLSALFVDPSIGGVGGRDWQPHERWDEPVVGIVSGYGRTVGNHHLGAGPARDVDLLKGVNACFRGDALRSIGFELRLRGRGNVSHWEMSLCFKLRRLGWRLVFDPAIGVEHRPASRHDGDVNARGGFEADSFVDSVHNETLALLEYLSPRRRAAFLTWAAAVGTGAEPGLAQLPRLWAKRRPNALARWRATVAGRLQGLSTYRRSRAARSGTGERP